MEITAKDIAISKFESAISEIHAILVESEFASRWVLIEAHHKVGQIVLSLPGDIAITVQRLALQLDRSERSLWYAVKFAKTFKTADDVPEGKNVSMNLVIKKYLTTPKEKEEHIHSAISICSSCKMRLDK